MNWVCTSHYCAMPFPKHRRLHRQQQHDILEPLCQGSQMLWVSIWSAPLSCRRSFLKDMKPAQCTHCEPASGDGISFLLTGVLHPALNFRQILPCARDIKVNYGPNCSGCTKICADFIPLTCSMCLQDFHRECSGLS